MDDLTSFQRDLLDIASGLDEPHGLAIKDVIDGYYEQDINASRLYPNLDTLAEKGLLEIGTIDRRTNSYLVTQRGWREIEARRQ